MDGSRQTGSAKRRSASLRQHAGWLGGSRRSGLLWRVLALWLLGAGILQGPSLASTRSPGLLSGLSAAADPVQASLHRDPAPASAGSELWLGLRLRHSPGWHTYWINPGDSGLPTTLAWQLPQAWSSPVPSWPIPERIAVGPLMNFGYEGDRWIPMRLRVPEKALPGSHALKVKIEWLMCSDICIPGGAELSLTLEIGSDARPGPSGDPVLKELKAALQEVPRQALEASAEVQGDKVILRLAAALNDSPSAPAKVDYFPEQAGWMVNAAEQNLQRDAQGAWSLVLARESGFADPVDPSGYLRVGSSIYRIHPPGALGDRSQTPGLQAGDHQQTLPAGDLTGSSIALSRASDPTLWTLVLMGLAGGLILNLMPCVFPVISLKLLSLVPRQDRQAQPSGSVPALESSVRRSAWLYAAGVVWSFWLLGLMVVLLQSAGQAVGWGFQLQQPGFVFGMFVLFLLIGANLMGLFEFSGGLMRAASAPQLGAFGSGVLAVVVATPCTAPFMGAALGVSLGQGPLEAMVVFTALALGMTLPYLILVLRPGLIRRMPKPGVWMDWMRKALAFPMFLAAVWLAWVFVLQTTTESVLWLGLSTVLLFAACWVYGSYVQPGLMRSEPRRLGAGFSALLLAAAVLAPLANQPPAGNGFGSSSEQSPERSPERSLERSPERSLERSSERSSEQSSERSSSGPGLPQASGTAPGAGPSASLPLSGSAWAPWSRPAVEAALAAGHLVFVDFTAAWCVSCQANKQLVLGTERVRELFDASGVRSFRADWTRQDPEITEELRRFGRRGVPMYLLLRQGREPLVLPELLTYGLVRDAVSALER